MKELSCWTRVIHSSLDWLAKSVSVKSLWRSWSRTRLIKCKTVSLDPSFSGKVNLVSTTLKWSWLKLARKCPRCEGSKSKVDRMLVEETSLISKWIKGWVVGQCSQLAAHNHSFFNSLAAIVDSKTAMRLDEKPNLIRFLHNNNQQLNYNMQAITSFKAAYMIINSTSSRLTRSFQE